MSIHVCKQCGSRFEYCRQCVFRPVRYKDAGFCSKECYEASKNVVVEPTPIVEDPVIVEETIIEIIEEEVEEASPTEPIIVAEPTIKNETNTYKKKKNKYKVHE